MVIDDNGKTYDLSPLADDIDGSFLSGGGIARVRHALRAGELLEVDVSCERIGAPVARPGAVICIGQNYAAHAAESGDAPPDQPIVFFKHPNTVVGPSDDVKLPPDSKTTDWEVELAVVIGATARYLPNINAARSCIAGYTISNDVSERTFQIDRSGGQWSKGKCCETFNPLGPSLIPTEDIPDVQALRLRSWVNDEPRQDSTSADMIFSVAELVHHLSQFMVLDPGDVINTGTPQGVAMSGLFPYLTYGDEVRLSIDGLGEQRQRIMAAGVPRGFRTADLI
ncbi:fumarylacetoacetate hydrolase family protein [Micromonospora sp. U56]|uniref:fumarylacetoacetate hydrolase family protein n=1 Tax=Micromonospora sp. U56 TaxID=2824900 RepID=UPI0027DE28E2|nr:fumarylacetoacetate hydrolase family protein [Micromonospora sp. U56]